MCIIVLIFFWGGGLVITFGICYHFVTMEGFRSFSCDLSQGKSLGTSNVETAFLMVFHKLVGGIIGPR